MIPSVRTKKAAIEAQEEGLLMNRWKQIGNSWVVEDAVRIREILKEERISCRIPFSSIFLANPYHLPAADQRFEICVWRKDLEKAIAVLVRESLLRPTGLSEEKAVPGLPAGDERRELLYGFPVSQKSCCYAGERPHLADG